MSVHNTLRRALAIAQCDDREILLSVPYSEFRFGLVCLAFGVAVVAMPLVLLALGHRDAFPIGAVAGIVGGGLLGGLFVVVGGVLAFRTDRLRLDLVSQTYDYCAGHLGFGLKQNGPLAEIDRLTLESEMEQHSDMKGRVWRVRLIWKNPNRSPLLLMQVTPGFANIGRDKRHMALEAMLQIAAKTGTPAYDEAGTNLTAGDEGELRSSRKVKA